jgi:outer membrane murein-binding lipoprotein Lpp
MVLPPSNVPPESQPWARTIESLISQGAVDLNSLSTKTDAAFKGQNATLGQLSGQITELNAQQDTLTTLVNSQISLDSNAQSSTNMAFSNVQTTYSSYTFGVPAGYNWATFFITGSGSCYNNTGSSVYFFLQTRVDSSTLAWVVGGQQQIVLTAGQQGTSSASCAGTFDVVGGGSVTVSIMAYTTNPTTAYSGNYVGFDGVIMFTK